MAGWGDYGWDHLLSRLNFAEGGNHFLEMSKIKRSLHPCGQGAREGKALPEPPVPPPSHNQLLTTPPFTPQYISRARGPGSPVRLRSSLAPPRTHTNTHTHTPCTHTPLTRSHPTQGPPPLPPSVFCLALDFLLTCRCFPRAGEGGDIVGEIWCAESDMAKINIFGA